MALMRYWSSEYCDWRVALVTEVGEEVCMVLTILFIATRLDSVRKVYNIEIVHENSPRQCQKGLTCLGGQGPPYILLGGL
jgi:hypothetical protein